MMDRDDRQLNQIVPRSVACVVLCRKENFSRLSSCNLGSRVAEQTDDKLIKCKLPGDHVIGTSGPLTRGHHPGDPGGRGL